jgi:hypothetical protein
MYHPSASIEFTDADDLEYIEITNNGDQTVDLTGVYFAGTGLVYQFPPNSSIGPSSSIILASNYTAFRLKYGFSPAGRFSRHLSNKGQNIVLCDGFGNIIDNVSYMDTIPWPEADGNGSYLKLTDNNLDNNDPASWIAANDVITSSETFVTEDDILIYPNPVGDILNINSGFDIKSITLFDIYGRQLSSVRTGGNSYELDMEQFSGGLYILRIVTSQGTYVRKIIKD